LILFDILYCSASVPKSISFAKLNEAVGGQYNSGDALSTMNIHPTFNGDRDGSSSGSENVASHRTSPQRGGLDRAKNQSVHSVTNKKKKKSARMVSYHNVYLILLLILLLMFVLSFLYLCSLLFIVTAAVSSYCPTCATLHSPFPCNDYVSSRIPK
jgi:hypothetical protein